MKIKLKDILQSLPSNGINALLVVNPDTYMSRELFNLLHDSDVQRKLNGTKIFFKPFGQMYEYKRQTDLSFDIGKDQTVVVGGVLKFVRASEDVLGVNIVNYSRNYSSDAHEKAVWVAEVNDKVGGIDFNSNNLNLKESGQEDDSNFSFEVLRNIQPNSVNGILPVIINISPITNFQLLLGYAKTSPQNS